MRHVRISYTIKDDIDLDEVKSKVRHFVGNMKEVSSDIWYTSYHVEGTTFMHIGYFPDEAVLKELQGQSFFGEFAGFLKERCKDGPHAAPLSVVASTSLE